MKKQRIFKNSSGDKVVIEGIKITLYHASTTPDVPDEDRTIRCSDILRSGYGSVRDYVKKLRKLGFEEVNK